MILHFKLPPSLSHHVCRWQLHSDSLRHQHHNFLHCSCECLLCGNLTFVMRSQHCFRNFDSHCLLKSVEVMARQIVSTVEMIYSHSHNACQKQLCFFLNMNFPTIVEFLRCDDIVWTNLGYYKRFLALTMPRFCLPFCDLCRACRFSDLTDQISCCSLSTASEIITASGFVRAATQM